MSWLAQKLGQQPARGGIHVPPVQQQPAPQQVYVPPGYQLVPVQQQHQPGVPATQQQQLPYNPKASYLGQGFTKNDIGKALKMWSGGEAMRTEGSLTCPNCDSAHYFRRANGGTLTNPQTGQVATPIPICADCGYQERSGVGYIQGDQANWIG